MPALPEETYPRLFIDYEGPMGQHTLQFRQSAGDSSAVAATKAAEFINTVKGIVYNGVTFNAARWAVAGSNVSNPIAWTPIAGTAAGTQAAAAFPIFVSWIGRTTGGRRVRLFLYGTNINPDSDFRLGIGDATWVSASVSRLNSSPYPIYGIDGLPPVWKSYVNVGYNAYFQRKRRVVA